MLQNRTVTFAKGPGLKARQNKHVRSNGAPAHDAEKGAVVKRDAQAIKRARIHAPLQRLGIDHAAVSGRAKSPARPVDHRSGDVYGIARPHLRAHLPPVAINRGALPSTGTVVLASSPTSVCRL
jgi:hypothetical protein